MPADPNRIFRVFWSIEDHVEEFPDGRRRISSALFKTKGLSVDDGAVTTAEESSERSPHKPNGVVSVPKTAFELEKLVLKEDDPADAEFRIEHRTVERVTGGQAKRLRDRSRVAIQMPGIFVRDGSGED
jgi:hypothetical protein